MLEALVMTAVMASGPDHHTLHMERVDMRKPHKGAWSEQIVEAAEVPKKWRPFAACVLDRESGATLEKIQSGAGARNPNSTASGRFQFLNSSWNEPLPYMVADRLKEFGVPKSVAMEIRLDLQHRPIYKWHGYWQQVGFLAVVSEDGGWRHWRGGNGCDSKRPR